MMNVLGIIPARGGSKTVPRKNIRLLGDKPLIAWSIDAAKNSRLLNSFIVSTDCDEIAQIARQYGASVPFMRPGELAEDASSSIDVVIHALRWIESKTGTTIDVAVMLQPTTPFRSALDVDAAINILENEPDADSVISVVAVGGTHPARMKYLEQGWLIDPPFCEEKENQPRQQLRPMYIRNGAIYATRRHVLLNNSFKGSRCKAVLMSEESSVNIDTEQDFDLAEFFQKKYFSNENGN